MPPHYPSTWLGDIGERADTGSADQRALPHYLATQRPPTLNSVSDFVGCCAALVKAALTAYVWVRVGRRAVLTKGFMGLP